MAAPAARPPPPKVPNPCAALRPPPSPARRPDAAPWPARPKVINQSTPSLFLCFVDPRPFPPPLVPASRPSPRREAVG
jgi:hypothetical protein